MAGNNEEALIRELRSRFPILERISGRFGQDMTREPIPWFFGIVLGASMLKEPGACCLVLDKTQGTTALTAVFVALARLEEDFPHLAERYARTAFGEGQHVRVKPSNFVYEYEGIWDGHPDLFRLKIQDKEERRSFPISEVLRLEPTTHKLPKGTLVSNLGVFNQTNLDGLIGLRTFGNSSIFLNVVLLHMPQTRFAGIVDIVSLGPDQIDGSSQLSDILPWGVVGPEGEIRANDNYQVIGEPLIAVTRVAQDLAAVASASPSGSKIVLVDGARGIANDLQAFDDVSERQRVVILASPDETEEIRLLREYGCPVWYMSAADVAIGEDETRERSRESLVGRTVRVARIRENCKVIPVACSSDELQTVATALERIESGMDDSDERAEVDELLARVYGILLEFSECCIEIRDEAKHELRLVRESLTQNRRWLGIEIANEFESAIDLLEGIAYEGIGLEQKAGALLHELVESNERWAIATRSTRTAACIRESLSALGIDICVVPIQAIRPDDEFDCIIVPAWPNSRRFTRLKNLAAAKEIRVLTYPFESRWLSGHQARERTLMRSNQMEPEQLAGILGVAPDLFASSGGWEPSPPMEDTTPELPIFKLENRVSRRRSVGPVAFVGNDETRRARLVEFYGGCHALLSEWSELHVLNELIDNALSEGGRLRTKTVASLSEGDYVLFRAGGGKEFIRLLAEDILGIEEYERIRTMAENWKMALRRLGNDPATVQMRLERQGLLRSTATIAGWLRNPHLIGPGDSDDVRIVAEASGDSKLLGDLDPVADAISRIRGAHIGAGSRLTQLIVDEVRGRLSQLDGQPVLLDLEYGQAWVVQVNAVDMEEQEHPIDQTNRLLWSDDPFF